MITGLVRRISGIRLFTSRTTPASGTVEDYPPATELISGDGGLCEKGLEDFIKLHECGVSYICSRCHHGPTEQWEKYFVESSIPYKFHRDGRILWKEPNDEGDMDSKSWEYGSVYDGDGCGGYRW